MLLLTSLEVSPSFQMQWRVLGRLFGAALKGGTTRIKTGYSRCVKRTAGGGAKIVVRGARLARRDLRWRQRPPHPTFPPAVKWDEAAADAIEDLVVQAVRREQQSSRRRRPFSSRSGNNPF